jgi:hypothetical protein
MKERPTGLVKQRKLNNRIYTEESENVLKPSKSEVHLGEKESKKKEEEIKMTSFR